MEVSISQGLPPENWRRLINEYVLILPNTTLRLKFTRNVLKHFHDDSEPHGFHRFRSERDFRGVLEAEIEKLLPGSDTLIKNAIRNGDISKPPLMSRHMGWIRRSVFLMVLVGLIFGISAGTVFLYRLIYGNHQDKQAITAGYPIRSPASNKGIERSVSDQPIENPEPDPLFSQQVMFQVVGSPTAVLEDSARALPDPKTIVEKAEENSLKEDFSEFITSPIWLVEKTADVETYSNGLQIITSFCVENIPRRYVVFGKENDALPGAERFSSEIRGILYHASEGDMAPFKPEKNRLLKQYSNQLLKYTCRKKGYHYLIDRFGRVYRIVRDQDAAFHAGNSVWADEHSIFLNLNHAFLGICFEGKGFEEISEADSTKIRIRAMDHVVITEAQIRSGKELTEWLRFHYEIPRGNCVPHGIASIYPKNRLIGYHLDLGHGFPFQRFGLRNKYLEMIPAITEFGFREDRYFHQVLNGNIWPGINRSEEYLKKRAKQKNISIEAYRKRLNQRFDRFYDWQKYLHDNPTTLDAPENDQ